MRFKYQSIDIHNSIAICGCQSQLCKAKKNVKKVTNDRCYTLAEDKLLFLIWVWKNWIATL